MHLLLARAKRAAFFTINFLMRAHLFFSWLPFSISSYRSVIVRARAAGYSQPFLRLARSLAAPKPRARFACCPGGLRQR